MSHGICVEKTKELLDALFEGAPRCPARGGYDLSRLHMRFCYPTFQEWMRGKKEEIEAIHQEYWDSQELVPIPGMPGWRKFKSPPNNTELFDKYVQLLTKTMQLEHEFDKWQSSNK